MRVLALFEEAVRAGARRRRAAEELGLSQRTLQRWRREQGGTDRRRGPQSAPRNKLSEAERTRILEVANSPEYRELSPKQIVPRLADRGQYVASESSFYRVLREAGYQRHRACSRPPRRRPRALAARAPNRVWSWDITYLPGPVRGRFFYLYVVVDVWSRMIVGWSVHEEESADHAATLIEHAAHAQGIRRKQLTLHADNGSPMKGQTMLTMLYWLGIAPSYSRPSVKDDNPYSEALFRTLKYRPEYPRRRFAEIQSARTWMTRFVRWYNHDHLHSAIRFVAPADRHARRDRAILANRRRVYAAARRRNPERWTRRTRKWKPVAVVLLNPDKGKDVAA